MRENSSYLVHHGVKGMRWGHRKQPERIGSRPRIKKKVESSSESRSKKVGPSKFSEKKVKKAKPDAKPEPKKTDSGKKYEEKKSDIKPEPTKTDSGGEYQKSKDYLRAESLKKKPIDALSNEDLNFILNRDNLEKRYRDITPIQLSTGKKIAVGLGAIATTALTQVTNIDRAFQAYEKIARISQKTGLTDLAKRKLSELRR